MAYCRNGVLVFDVFEVGLVSKSEFFDPFVRSGSEVLVVLPF